MIEKKLHVLQVTGTMNRGGAEVMLMDIFRNVSPGVRFDFLINTKKDDPHPHGVFDDEIVGRGGRVLYIGTQWELGIAKYILNFRKIIQNIGKPDVVHIHLNAKCGVIALAARLCGIKKIVAHSHAALNFKGPLRKILPSIVELKFQKILISWFATDFWGCSEAANQSLFNRRACAKNTPVVLRNAVDVDRFQSVSEGATKELRSAFGAKTSTLVLGNVGRVVRHKKVDFIIDVLGFLKEVEPDFLFVFAGREDDSPYMEEIKRKARALGVEDRVLHLGDRDDIPAIMSTFDVFVGPALNEGFGLVAAEAQAIGGPSVLSTGFPQQVDMGLDLISFMGNYQPEQWVDAILRVKENRCVDKALIARKIDERGFDAVKNTRRVEQLYRAM